MFIIIVRLGHVGDHVPCKLVILRSELFVGCVLTAMPPKDMMIAAT